MKKYVAYKIHGAFQCKVGEVLKEGSRKLWILEQNIPSPEPVQIDIQANHVIYLLGAKNDFNQKHKAQNAKNKKSRRKKRKRL